VVPKNITAAVSVDVLGETLELTSLVGVAGGESVVWHSQVALAVLCAPRTPQTDGLQKKSEI